MKKLITIFFISSSLLNSASENKSMCEIGVDYYNSKYRKYSKNRYWQNRAEMVHKDHYYTHNAIMFYEHYIAIEIPDTLSKHTQIQGNKLLKSLDDMDKEMLLKQKIMKECSIDGYYFATKYPALKSHKMKYYKYEDKNAKSFFGFDIREKQREEIKKALLQDKSKKQIQEEYTKALKEKQFKQFEELK